MRAFAAALLEHGVPTTREESWRYTALDAILAPAFIPAPVGLGDELHAADVDALAGRHGETRLVFVNGVFAPVLSATRALDGVRCTNLAATTSTASPLLVSDARPSRSDGFRSLNAAAGTDGALICIDPSATIIEPIHVVHLSAPGVEPTASHARTVIEAGAASSVTVIETYAGTVHTGATLTNAATTILAGDAADVTHHRVQTESPTTMHVGHTAITQDAGSHVHSTSFMLGAAAARSAVDVLLRGRDARVDLRGLYLATGTQRLDNPVTVEHAASGCASTQLFKGVIDDRARGSFSGHVLVQPGTSATDAHQTSRSLTLTPTAQADARPWLEILADDVRCTHGATIGRLDDEAMFYLRARGIPLAIARTMLIEAFVGEILDSLESPTLRSALESTVAAKLGER